MTCNHNWKSVTRRCMLLAALAALAAVFLTGCTPEMKYKTHTFFFTGVPDPNQRTLAENGKLLSPALMIKKRRRSALERIPDYYMHGPYGAGACHLCHSTEDSGKFRVWGTNKTAAGPAKTVTKKVVGTRLKLPTEELCISCHEDFLDSNMTALDVGLHEPVAKGLCVHCHNPHRSTREFMLQMQDDYELCTDCHEKEKLISTVDHLDNPKVSCLDCHNPHFGRTALLLKADYGEWDRYGLP